MKNLFFYSLLGALALLTSCSGSSTYQGKWYARYANNDTVDIVFYADSFIVYDQNMPVTFQYTQNSVQINNSIEKYGITADNGKSLFIHFPIADDETKGAILDANEQPIMIISRNEYATYEDVYGL